MKIVEISTDCYSKNIFFDELTVGDFCTYIFFKSTALLNIDSTACDINCNTSMVFSGDCSRSVIFTGKSVTYDRLVFLTESSDDRTLFSSLPQKTPIPIRSPYALNDILLNISNHFPPTDAHCYSINHNFCNILLHKTLQCLSDTRVYDGEHLHRNDFIELRQKIYDTPDFSWNVENMSEDVHLSSTYFQNLYKRFFGCTCTSDVINARMLLSKKLLSKTGDSVSDIAEKCGYKNVEHFIRQFKTATGITPGKYRKFNFS